MSGERAASPTPTALGSASRPPVGQRLNALISGGGPLLTKNSGLSLPHALSGSLNMVGVILRHL